MDKLVMNFLVTEGYLEAAEKFRLESGTEEIDIATSTRATVKKAVQNDNMEDAIQKVNDLYPEILVTNPQLYFHLRQQQFIDLILNGKVEEALEFVRAELAPKAEKDEDLLEELEVTVSLLAFEDITNCPLSKLLDSHRIRIADEVNAAILLTQLQEKDPRRSSVLNKLMKLQKALNMKAGYLEADYVASIALLLARYLEDTGDLLHLL